MRRRGRKSAMRRRERRAFESSFTVLGKGVRKGGRDNIVMFKGH